MPIQVNEIEYCKDTVHFVAEAVLVEEKIQEAIKQCRKLVIPGFRPGKAPDLAIKLKMKPQIERWVKQELQVEAYNQYVFDTKAKPIGFPVFKKSELHELDYWCEFTILKKPKFELKQYKDFEIPQPHQSQSATEIVEGMLQELRLQHGEVVPYEEQDLVSVGDKITIDRLCTLEGEELSGFTKEGELHTVDNSEFDSYLLGMKVGETKEFEIVVRQDAPVEELRGKASKWKVTVHAGLKTIPAPLDDELAKKTGNESYEKLRQALEGSAANRLQAVQTQLISQQIIKRILTAHEFEIPSWLANMEAQQLAANMGASWDQLTPEQKEIFLSQGKSSVKLALIMDSIREAEPETVFTNSELLNVIRQRLAESGQDPEKFLVEAERDGRLIGILEALRNDATLQWLVEHSKIVE
jgi:trigger factor